MAGDDHIGTINRQDPPPWHLVTSFNYHIQPNLHLYFQLKQSTMVNSTQRRDSYRATATSRRDAVCSFGNMAFLLRFISWLVSSSLIAISILGFQHLGKSRIVNLEDAARSTSFGCLCFLGFCFGCLLFLAETFWELFYFLFGFLRYRIGKCIIYWVSGSMTLLMGKDMGKQCKCTDFALLVIVGIACIIVGVVQFFSIVFLGNLCAPARSSSDTTSNEKEDKKSNAKLLQSDGNQVGKRSSEQKAAPSGSQTEEKPAVSPPASKADNSHLPAWMRV